jgi:hypothetical protein
VARDSFTSQPVASVSHLDAGPALPPGDLQIIGVSRGQRIPRMWVPIPSSCLLSLETVALL